ncbi:MAG: Fic family protein [Clostridium sp.]|nr:Fic family protein [Bacteroides sp.]MCM1197258.1 Fic family protein [Clostridium sp.]
MADFEDYIRQGEPDRQQRAHAWQTAIGLQAVDGLKTSEYLVDTARRHIEGDITIDEARELIKSYYQSKSNREPEPDSSREADTAAANITKILSTRTLDFSANGYVSLHRRIFEGVFEFAGKIRNYNISKKEWVLDGDSVSYLDWEDLYRAIDYDIEQERNFNYAGLSQDEIICHIAHFVSGLWQIHAFGEGNTRTTAVFTIMYLRSIGFDVDNNLFAEHSWYFRNALVRANYKNVRKGIDYTLIYLERFFRNLLLGDSWDLRNRYLHINPSEEWKIQPNLADVESAGQVQDKFRTSTVQEGHSISPEIEQLLAIVGKEQLSVATMMESLQLSGRDNFLKLYLSPAIRDGYIAFLYPDRPRHPRQKYHLTAKGLALLSSLSLGCETNA